MIESNQEAPNNNTNDNSNKSHRKVTVKKVICILVLMICLGTLITATLYKYSLTVRSFITFGNYFVVIGSTLYNPGPYLRSCGKNIEFKNGDITYRGWYVKPFCTTPDDSTKIPDKMLTQNRLNFTGDSQPIFIYYHGYGDTRAYISRIYLYKRLAFEMNSHVVAFDYAGYGDSTNIRPSKLSVTSDAILMYKWLLSQDGASQKRITVWGHSLGTSIATMVVANLTDSMKPINLILESPFDNIANVVYYHPFAVLFRYKPLSYIFEFFYIDTMRQEEDVNFDTTLYIGKIGRVYLLIMHAQDDLIIDYKLGKNLHQIAVKKLDRKQVEMITVNGDKGLGHLFIVNDDETMSKVKALIDRTRA